MFCCNTAIYYHCIASFDNISLEFCCLLDGEAEEKEQSKSQEDIYTEESIYKKFTGTEDNKIMPEFHKVEWDQKMSVLSKLKDERLKYFGKKLIYMDTSILIIYINC